MIPTIHSAESLNSLSRKALIAAALEAGIEKPYTTKSAVLVEAILATQAPADEVAPVATEEVSVAEAAPVDASATAEAPVAEEAPAPAAAETAPDNVVPFEPSVEQTEIPAEPASSPSRGLFKVNRKVFQRQLAAAARITAASKTMPVLSCVLIDFIDGRLAVEANDLSNHLRTETQAETSGAYRIAIPHAVLSKFVSRCASEFLMAEVRGETLVISDLENRTEIMGIPSGEFPPAHPSVDVALMEIAGKQLVRVIGETVKAASTDESRYILNGLGIDTTAGFVVTTDGRRLVRMVLGAENVVPVDHTLILPTHAALTLAAGVPQDVTVKVSRTGSGNLLRFATESVGYAYTLTTRMVEGRYPLYQQVIPSFKGDTFDFSNEELNAALGRLLVVVDASDKGTAIKLDFSAEALVLNAVNVSVGTGKETVALRSDGNALPRHTALNGRFLAEVIGSWSDERVNVSICDECSPVVVRTPDKVAVIMPVRLS